MARRRRSHNFGASFEFAGEEKFWGVSRVARRRRRKSLVVGNVCRKGGMACGPSAAVCRPVGCCAQDDTGGRPRGRSTMIWNGGREGCPQGDTGGRTRGVLAVLAQDCLGVWYRYVRMKCLCGVVVRVWSTLMKTNFWATCEKSKYVCPNLCNRFSRQKNIFQFLAS